MSKSNFSLTVTATTGSCAIGETVGQQCAAEGAIPVLSCEGACIRGEIARLAANRLARTPGFRRACHGELFAVPDSAMAQWVKSAAQVVVIDGCHLRCHGRIVEHLVPAARLRSFNAYSRHRRYSDLFDLESVPETERQAVAHDVAGWVQGQLATNPDACGGDQSPPSSCGCGGTAAGNGAVGRNSRA